jgi:hypothetical protein
VCNANEHGIWWTRICASEILVVELARFVARRESDELSGNVGWNELLQTLWIFSSVVGGVKFAGNSDALGAVKPVSENRSGTHNADDKQPSETD